MPPPGQTTVAGRTRPVDLPGDAAVTGAAPAAAATNQFRGMNWAVLGDNFSTGPLVVSGLSQSDSNATVRAKANALYDDMAAMGVNTVRLPINTHLKGVIDSPPGTGPASEPLWKA